MSDTLPHKKRFYDICTEYDIYSDGLQVIVNRAGVSRSTVDAMFAGTAVEREEGYYNSYISICHIYHMHICYAVVNQVLGATCNGSFAAVCVMCSDNRPALGRAEIGTQTAIFDEAETYRLYQCLHSLYRPTTPDE